MWVDLKSVMFIKIKHLMAEYYITYKSLITQNYIHTTHNTFYGYFYM